MKALRYRRFAIGGIHSIESAARRDVETHAIVVELQNGIKFLAGEENLGCRRIYNADGCVEQVPISVKLESNAYVASAVYKKTRGAQAVGVLLTEMFATFSS